MITFPTGMASLWLFCSFNVCDLVCDCVCGLSTERLRQVSMDADGVFGPEKFEAFFREG